MYWRERASGEGDSVPSLRNPVVYERQDEANG